MYSPFIALWCWVGLLFDLRWRSAIALEYEVAKESIMTKTILKSGILSLLALTIPTHAFAVTIGFEGLSNGTVVTNQFPDVVFSSNAGFENQVATRPGLGFGDNFICTAPTAGSINCTQETILTFSSVVNNLSFYQVGDNANGVVALVDVFENGLFSSTVNIFGFDTPLVPDIVDLQQILFKPATSMVR